VLFQVIVLDGLGREAIDKCHGRGQRQKVGPRFNWLNASKCPGH